MQTQKSVKGAQDFQTLMKKKSLRGYLIKAEEKMAPKEVYVFHTYPWMTSHFLCFLIGGTIFIAGSILLLDPFAIAVVPGNQNYYIMCVGVTYTIGFFGFLFVNVIEFCTFTMDNLLRLKISLSMIGSACYVVGSIGFIPGAPPNTNFTNPNFGVVGFIMGSLFISCSQLWKTYRIGRTDLTATGVEFNACLGAWFFFIGTVMDCRLVWFSQAAVDDNYTAFYNDVIIIWIVGSCHVTPGALFLRNATS